MQTGEDSAENGDSNTNTNTAQQANSSVSVSNPFSQVGLRGINEGPRINIAPAGGRLVTPKKRDHSTVSNGGSGSRREEPVELWENRTLSSIFRFTVDPAVTRDAHGHHMYFLKDVRKDLEERDEGVRLSTSVLDQAILEVASNLEKTTPLEYLLACWKRVSRQFRALKALSSEDPKQAIIREARRLCMSFCMFAVTMPDMFG